jgi:hypothetical protein
MAKYLIGPDNGFIAWAPPSGRSPVYQLGRRLAGPTFSGSSFSLKLMKEDQLSDFMSRRIRVTVSKVLFAAAQTYAEGRMWAPLTVEGATLQDGTGHSSSVEGADGRSYHRGIEAAHFGIGTVIRGGEALSEHAARLVLIERAAAGVKPNDIRRFTASGRIAAFGLAHDASTYTAPRFLNRAEGLVETAVHPDLTLLLPLIVPQGPEALEQAMNTLAARVVEFCAGEGMLVPINGRLNELVRPGTRAKEHLQDPADDVENRPFGGSEKNLLEAERDLLRGRTGNLGGLVEGILRDVPIYASDLTGLAVEARQERAEVRPPQGDASGGSDDSGSEG